MWQHLVLAALATACVSTTLSKTTIFEPIRVRGPKLWRELITCPWCLNHWLAPWMLAIQPGSRGGVGEFAVLALATIFVATLLVAILMRLFLHHEAEKAHLRQLLAAANARAGNGT